jgi:hypothetical protein
VHRFHHPWEAAASLRVRAGDATIIDTYATAGRLHPVNDPDDAVTAVFAHWQTARPAGGDVLMLGRTRADVDQLNTLAKTAAQARGESSGPDLLSNGRSWQAGDLLRARRNNRRIPLGDSHVKNGDRYRVIGPTVDGGLLVDDLGSRGRTILPPSYVAEHVDYGWASTIDTAQGATADIAILLIRPGLDREHLYVGLTRGRAENHAYIAANADDECDHQHTNPQPAAQRILIDALARSSRQHAAHALLERAEAPPTSWRGQAVAASSAGRWRLHDRDRAIVEQRSEAGSRRYG